MQKLVKVIVYHGQIIQDGNILYDVFMGDKERVQATLRYSLSKATGEFAYDKNAGELKAAEWKITEIPVDVLMNMPEEPHEYMLKKGVFIEGFGVNKISVIKAVRECTGLALKEAKDLVEAACLTNPVRINDTYGIGLTALKDRLIQAGVPYDCIEIR